MLVDEASNLNLNDGSIDIKFDVENCSHVIPSTNGVISNDDQHIIRNLQLGHTSKGSIINEKQHVTLLQAPVSDQNSENKNILENHFGVQDTFKRTMNGSLQ